MRKTVGILCILLSCIFVAVSCNGGLAVKVEEAPSELSVQPETDVCTDHTDDVVGEGQPQVDQVDQVDQVETAGAVASGRKETSSVPITVFLDGIRVQPAGGGEGPYVNRAWLDGTSLNIVDGNAMVQFECDGKDHLLRVAYIEEYGDIQIVFADVTTVICIDAGDDVHISGTIPEITGTVQFIPTLLVE